MVGIKKFFLSDHQTNLLCTVRLSGLMSGNSTASFIGFLITAKNEFEDEENGQFIAPLPAGVSRMECKQNIQTVMCRLQHVLTINTVY